MLKHTLILMALAAVIAGCAAAGRDGGRVAVAVTEKGFEPAIIHLKQGQPVTLVVTRRTERTCAKEMVIADYGVRKNLPLDQAVEITFTPAKSGEVRYACGMDMIAGKLIVQ
jgi:plastocyanin domain-containing protein